MTDISITGAFPVSASSGSVTVLLNGVTATGAGAAVDLGTVRWDHSIYTSWSSSPTNVTVYLEVSLDNVIWRRATDENYADGVGEGTALSTVTVGARYVRARLNTLTGGTSPQVTVTYVGR